MKVLRLKTAIGALAALSAATALAGECAYSFAWYAGPTVANFPAPMTLRAGENGFTYDGFAEADGSDLRVKDAEGNLLPHEIERWDPSGYSIVWVKLPSLSPSAAVTLSWGDASAEASADGVWDDDFLHVFHFGDDAKKNSSSWNYTTTQTTADRVGGIVGQGHTWKGDLGTGTRRITATGLNAKEKTGGASTFTISCWIKDGQSSVDSYICRLGKSSQLCLLYNYYRTDNPHLVELYGPSAAFRTNSKILLPDTDWHHVAYTYDGAKLIKYLDGAVYGTTNVTATVAAFAETSHNIFVGGAGGYNNPMEGSVDELRVEKTVRSADWIKACYSTPALVHDYDEVVCELTFPEYDRDAVLHDFPTMVTLGDCLPGLSGKMKELIYDRYRLHFFTEDGTELYAEPETVPETAGSVGTYWLNLPTFTRGTKVRVQATPTAWPTLTHSTTAAYATNNWGDAYYHVWHLASTLFRYDSASGCPLNLATAVSWTNYAAAAVGPTGRYGAIQTGSNAVVIAQISSDARALTNRFTVSFWAKKSKEDFANPRKGYVFQMRNNASARQIAVITGYSGDGNELRLWDSAAGINSSVSTYCVSIPDADWHYYAFTCDGTTTRAYRDGVEAASFDSAFNFDLPSITNNWSVTMGSTTRTQSFYGLLDEFRIENEPRSADWIYASYRNQRSMVHDLVNLPAPAFGTERAVAASAPDALDFKADLVCKVSSEVTFFYGPSDGGTSASAWADSVSLGAREAGTLVATVAGLAEDQGICGRFRAVNAHGEAWSEPLAGRAWTEPTGRYANIVVTNLAYGVALTDFPLCVKFPASVGLPEDPAGMRFIDADGNALAFEIETWDAADESVVWVRVPSLAQGTGIRALWSKTTAAHGATHADTVWNSEYKAVYHLASGDDSSPNVRHFTDDASSVDAAGVVGRGRSFIRTGKEKMNRSAPWFADLSGPFTISGWIRPAADASASYMMQMHDSHTQFAILYNWEGGRVLELYHNNNMNAYGSSNQTSDMRYTASPMTIPDDGGWHHFAYSYDQEAFSVYLDGELVRSLPRGYSLGSGDPGRQGVNLALGQTGGGDNRFKGDLDEIRFESARRSADWIRACYLNQKDALVSVTPATAGFRVIFR